MIFGWIELLQKSGFEKWINFMFKNKKTQTKTSVR